MRDGSVSYPSVLEAICSYCSSASLCRQCGNVFALKGNLTAHMKTHSRLLKCAGGITICLFMQHVECGNILAEFIFLLACCFVFQMH